MASIFKRGKRGTWWIKYYADGRQIYHSLNTTNARAAEKIKRQIEGDEARGDLIAPSKMVLPEFLEDYCRFLATIRTAKSYKNELSVLRIFFGPICPSLEPGSCVNKRWTSAKRKPVQDTMQAVHIHARFLEDVTTARIEDLICRRIRDEGIAPKTANNMRATLHRMFSYAIKKWNFVATDRRKPNPAAAVERRTEPARTIRFLTLEDVEKQLDALREHPTLQALAATYIYAGLRREAALWLTMEDVDLKRRLIHVRAKTIDGEFWQPKTKRNRVVPISEALVGILTGYFPKRRGPWFFPSPTGRRWDPDNFSQDLRTINRQHHLDWSCLDFRHTFGSQLAQKGESLFKIAELMGNSPNICRKHYAALQPDQMHDVVEFSASKTGKISADDTSRALMEKLLMKLNNEEAAPAKPKLRIAR